MKFEETGDPQHPHRLIFEGDEGEIVRAVFRELIYNLASKGNSRSISRHDAYIADWTDFGKKDVHIVTVLNYENIVEKLVEFHENTDEAISDIPEVSGMPPFLSEDIPERFNLGGRALRLADEIRRQVIEHYTTMEATDIDGEFSKLLGGEQPPA